MLKILARASQCFHIAASSYSLHTTLNIIVFFQDFASQMVMLFHYKAGSTKVCIQNFTVLF